CDTVMPDRSATTTDSHATATTHTYTLSLHDALPIYSWATRPSTSEAAAASSSSPVAARTHSLRSLCSRNAVMSSTTIIRQALPSVAPIRRRAGDDISHYQRESAADAAAPASDRAESVDHGSLRLRTVRGPPEQVLRSQAMNGPGPRRAR